MTTHSKMLSPFIMTSVIFYLLNIPAPAQAAPSVPATSKSKSVASPADISAPPRTVKSVTPPPAASGAKDRILWDYWYTVTVNKVVHYEYYNDRAELRSNRFAFLNRAWKQEEDYINEEQIGSFSDSNADLTPLFFNFHSTYRSTETTIDGNMKDRKLTVRIRKGNTELPAINKQVPTKTFLSGLFPIWLGTHIPLFKPGQVYPFQTILEDNLEAEFSTINGQVRIDPPDELAIKTRSTRLTVNYREMKSIWWVDALGAPLRIEMPLQKTVVERVPKEKATAFLDDN